MSIFRQLLKDPNGLCYPNFNATGCCHGPEHCLALLRVKMVLQKCELQRGTWDAVRKGCRCGAEMNTQQAHATQGFQMQLFLE